MRQTQKIEFPSRSFEKRLTSMVKVDARRMFTTPLFYVMLGIALAIPILILVMTSMVGGIEVTDPNTGAAQTMEAFTNTWQIIRQTSGADSMMSMDMTAMCNINLMYFMAGVFVCIFVSEDFRSGYAKNLFTVRAGKNDYVVSKTLTGFFAGALFLLAFFIGSILGGSFAGLSFDLGTAGIDGLVMCMLAKIFLMAVFASIFLVMSVVAKQRTWLSILLSLFAGMLLFLMIPMMTPLDSGVMNVFLCLAGGVIFAAGIGVISNAILRKTSLV